MRKLTKILTLVAALLVTGSALEAQRAARGVRPARPMLRRAMADSGRRAQMKQRLQAMTPEQRTALRQRMAAGRAERKLLAQQLRSGQITKAEARVQMRQWQKANRPQQNPRAPVRKPVRQ